MAKVNEYQEAARLKKAMALTNALVAGKITADLARAMDENEWQLVAWKANQKLPSPTTRDMVILQLEQMEAK